MESIHSNPTWSTVRSVALLILASALSVLAEDIVTLDHHVYKNARITEVEPDGVTITHSVGITKVPYTLLPEGLRKRFHFDPKVAREYTADADEQQRHLYLQAHPEARDDFKEQERADQERHARREAEERARVEAEEAVKRRRAEAQEAQECAHLLTVLQTRKAKADTDLRHAFASIEGSSRSPAIDLSAVGTLEGQAFIATRGRDNVKLGAVSLFLLDKGLGETRRRFIAEYRSDMDAILRDAESKSIRLGRNDTTRDRYYDLLRDIALDESPHRLFSIIAQDAAKLGETDADGNFKVEIPKHGEYVLAAYAERKLLKGNEQYIWLEPVSLEANPSGRKLLSNTNVLAFYNEP